MLHIELDIIYLAFCCYLHHKFFNHHRFRADGILIPVLRQALSVVHHNTETMNLMKLIFLLAPILTHGQSIDTGRLGDSCSDRRFNIDIIGIHGKLKSDTTYYNDGKIASIGHYAIDKKSITSGNQAGLWTKYYNNGQIRSRGNYEIYSALYYISATKTRRLDHSYKTGVWTYYYENGQTKAKGQYQIITQKANTGIPDQYKKIPAITDSWIFLNSDGSVAVDKTKLIAEIEHNPNCD